MPRLARSSRLGPTDRVGTRCESLSGLGCIGGSALCITLVAGRNVVNGDRKIPLDKGVELNAVRKARHRRGGDQTEAAGMRSSRESLSTPTSAKSQVDR